MKTRDIDVRNERTFVGVVNSDGTFNRGSGFTCVRNSLGNYTVRFSGAKFIKSCVAQVSLAGAGILTVYYSGPDSVNILIYTTGNASVDANFSFTTTALMNSN